MVVLIIALAVLVVSIIVVFFCNSRNQEETAVFLFKTAGVALIILIVQGLNVLYGGLK